jgi:hypothetical protein
VKEEMELTIDKKTGEKIRNASEGFYIDVSDFAMSFLPDATQTHVNNMKKEALLGETKWIYN